MQQRRYEFIMEAVQPIAHHGETLGNTAILMRRKARLPDGTFANLPVITADTMRHGLREAGSYALLDAAGLLDDPSLTESALRLLFAGGMMTGRGDGATVKLDEWRDMGTLFPHLGLLGGCAFNRIIPGRVQVDDAILLCEENGGYVPPWAHEWLSAKPIMITTHRAYVEEVQRVRMDPSLSPEKRKLLTDGARAAVEGRLLASATAAEDDDAVAREDSKSSMMPRRFETLIRGSLFYWAITATTYNAIDDDALLVMLAGFLYDCRVGGKRGTGHGLLRALCTRNVELLDVAERVGFVAVADLARACGERFKAHVAERREKIAAFLATVDA